MKRIIWGCDTCRKETDGYVIPVGWLEASFQSNGKWYRYCFCGYRCLTEWSERHKEHYQNTFEKEEVRL